MSKTSSLAIAVASIMAMAAAGPGAQARDEGCKPGVGLCKAQDAPYPLPDVPALRLRLVLCPETPDQFSAGYMTVDRSRDCQPAPAGTEDTPAQKK